MCVINSTQLILEQQFPIFILIFSLYLHEKNGFAEKSKISTGYRSEILLNYQNNVEHSNQLLEYQNFLQRCLLFLKFQQNYF